MELAYRPFIDGLRAVAVLAVIVFHMNPELLPGGYLGVDVFFVISGFVISQSLYKSYLRDGRVNLLSFYIRRFKRLYPALLTMVATTAIAYALYGFQWDVNLFLKSALTSILAVSNLYFLYRGTDYFHQDLINPLLHTWSLGVEEQFYFIYPLLLLGLLSLLGRQLLSLKRLVLVLATISIVSFVVFVSDLGWMSDFYSPLARFWELGVGCFIFFLSQLRNYDSRLAVMVGAGLVLASLAFGVHLGSLQLAVFTIVLGSATLIYVGLQSSQNVIIDTLSRPVFTYIGRISYSLYLWHLPVLYFSYLYLTGFSYYTTAALMTFAVAMLSYHLIEKPVRHSEPFDKFLNRIIRYAPHGIAVALMLLVVVSPVQIKASINQTFNQLELDFKSINYIESQFGLGERIKPNYTLNGAPAIECSDIEHLKTLSTNELGLYEYCLKRGQSNDLYYLTGDSHSFHFLSMFDQVERIDNLYFVEISRQNIVERESKLFDEVASDVFFVAQKEQFKKLSETYDNIYLFTSFFLSPHQEQIDHMRAKLQRYIDDLSPYATITFIAPTPVFTSGPESCVLLHRHCQTVRADDEQRRKAVNDMLREFAENNDRVLVYDPYYEICPEEVCFTYEHETDFLRFIDKDHISHEMSLALTPHFVAWLEENLK